MTDDAMKARAREVLKQIVLQKADRNVKAAINAGFFPCIDVDWHEAIRAMIAFATAEAASGAGEREGLAKRLIARTSENPMMPVKDSFLMREAAAALASLPPATDPAKEQAAHILARVGISHMVGKCGWKSYSQAKPTSEMLDAAEREGWDRAAAEQVWIAMRLAAGSTTPATEVAS